MPMTAAALIDLGGADKEAQNVVRVPTRAVLGCADLCLL
jgi:hypothetical protein